MAKQKFTLDHTTQTNVTGEVNVLVEYERIEGASHPDDPGATYRVSIALSDRPHFPLVATYQHGWCLEGFGGPDDIPEWLDEVLTLVEKRLFEVIAR